MGLSIMERDSNCCYAELSVVNADFQVFYCYAEYHFAHRHWAECCMMTVFTLISECSYAECHLCWFSSLLLLCWVSFCWVSLDGMLSRCVSLRWMSWRKDKHSSFFARCVSDEEKTFNKINYWTHLTWCFSLTLTWQQFHKTFWRQICCLYVLS